MAHALIDSRTRRYILAAVVAVGVVAVYAALPTAAAFADHCFVTGKPDGAGNFGDVVINLTDPSGDSDVIPTNPGGQVAGGFVDVYLDFDGDGAGDELVADDVFLLPPSEALFNPESGVGTLPVGAHASAGQGKGIDALEE